MFDEELGLAFEDDYDPVSLKVGDIVSLKSGRKYRITKKTTTAVAVERYFWWDKIFDKIFRRNY